jgi:hypothetical protein
MKERIVLLLKHPYHALVYSLLHKCKVEDIELRVLQIILEGTIGKNN